MSDAPELRLCPFCKCEPDGYEGDQVACRCGAMGPHEIAGDPECPLWNAAPDPALFAEVVEALRANLTFAEKIAEAVDIDPEETALNVRVMPEGREVARRTWAEVMQQGRAILAKLEARDGT